MPKILRDVEYCKTLAGLFTEAFITEAFIKVAFIAEASANRGKVRDFPLLQHLNGLGSCLCYTNFVEINIRESDNFVWCGPKIIRKVTRRVDAL